MTLSRPANQTEIKNMNTPTTLETNVAALQTAFLSIGEMPVETDDFIAALDAVGVTDEAMIAAGLAVTGSVLCRADGSEIIADLSDSKSWAHGVRCDRAKTLAIA
jgi:hypothetical protein